jgi:hypothetical protein
MRAFKGLILLPLSLTLCAASCGDRQRIQRTVPPVGDLRVQEEPPIPAAAFEMDPATGEPTPEALEAEAGWNDQVLIWGRAGWRTVGRICRWAEDVAGDIPDLDCPQPE